jgi:4-hydroxyacetophenone monooxygenase
MKPDNLVASALASDAELEEFLKDAHLPTLLPALAYATADLSILRDEFRPNHVATPLGFQPQGGLSAGAQDRARALALEILRQLPEDLDAAITVPESDDVRRIMEYMLGPVPEEYFSLLIHELGHPRDSSAPGWRKPEVAPDRPFTVAIIGAGMSGIAAAYRLKQAQVPFVILERNGEAGGVWSENSYPGCRLDTSNFSYSYSFDQNGSWEDQYSTRRAVLNYLQGSAEKFDLLSHIRFNTQMVSGEFDESDNTWKLTLKTADGTTEFMRVQAIVSAVGQLNQPNYPKLNNADSFRGHAWHTARWNHDVDLAGKRVGVIGTGASAFQAIQKVAEIAGEVTIFQRTAPWVIPTPGYTSPVKPGLRWLFENLPHYHRWYRVFSFWSSVDSRRPYAEVDPNWDHPLSVSAKNESLRQVLLTHLENSLGDRPDILEKMTPAYPPYAKRTLRDDGNWMETLKRPNVKLVSESIRTMLETGIETEDGSLHDFDVLIYGTGFLASDFLSTMSLTGRGGVNLREQWDGDARAYYGVTIPNFPNLFCLYGPNTNLNANGSVVLFSEAGVDYVLDSIRILLKSGHRAMDVRWDVFDEYNERVDAANRRMVYGASAVNSWYKNAKGRVTQNWPLKSVEYWKGTRRVNEGDYRFR